ncbi:hypothetical protein CYY_006791 [Polysphondylium violaceum]|uniref:DOCK family protein n=1 Tax=Polysphondylium violaceum TaxID=133409 RepID=A0A8J4PQG6_9MYCE|nr:hypothetical protein CYY_006791 [Polysphondylium violaceum]
MMDIINKDKQAIVEQQDSSSVVEQQVVNEKKEENSNSNNGELVNELQQPSLTTLSEINTQVTLLAPATSRENSETDLERALNSNNSSSNLIESFTTTTTTTTTTNNNNRHSIAIRDTSGGPHSGGGRSSGGLDSHKYRDFIQAKLASNHVKDDPLSPSLVYFPKDDLSLLVTEAQHRVIPNTSSSDLANSDVNQHVKSSFESFGAPRKTVTRNYAKFRKDVEKVVLDHEKYECDIIQKIKEKEAKMGDTNSTSSLSLLGGGHSPKFGGGSAGNSKRNSAQIEEPIDASDDLHFEFQTPITAETDKENAEQRQQDRQGFFKNYKPDYNWGSGTEVSLCNRTNVDFWQKQAFLNVLIELKGLVFVLGDHEPFFCTLFLYDYINKRRVSETFHFDFNPDRIKNLLESSKESKDSSHEDTVDHITQSKHLIVSLPQKQERDIWMIVKVNKIMQGDPDLNKEPYVTEKDIAKSKLKVSTSIQDVSKRLGRFHQAFSICAMPISTETGQIRVGQETCYLYKQVPKDLPGIQDLIDDIKDPAKKKKLKTLFGALTVIIHKPDSELPPYGQRLDPSYSFVKASEPFNTTYSSSSSSINSNINNNQSNSNSNNNNNNDGSSSPTITISDTDSNNSNSSPNSLQASANDVPPSINATTTSMSSLSLTTTSIPQSTSTEQLSELPPPSPRSKLQHAHSEMSSANMRRGATVPSLIPVIREIQPFTKVPELIPHYQYMNNLFLYPDTVNLTKAHGRNITIKVEIREDDTLSTPSLKLIYGKSSCQRFSSSFYTETHYHNKTPTFIDELKIKLPTRVSPRLHILFSYYHIVCKVKKGEESSDQMVGFSVLPLYKDRKICETGNIQLPIAVGNLKDKYLRNFETDYTLLENGKNLFKFDLKLFSSLYAQNEYINKFLLYAQDEFIRDVDLIEALQNFSRIETKDGKEGKDAQEAQEAIRFFNVIMNNLIHVICNRESTVGCIAIKAMFVLLSKIQKYLGDSNARVPFFVSYVQHVFDNPPHTRVPVYTALSTRFVYFLMRKRQTSNDLSDLSNTTIFSFSWFIYDLIVKSLALYKLDEKSKVQLISYLTSIGSSDSGNDSKTPPPPAPTSGAPASALDQHDTEFMKYLPKLVSFGVYHIQNAISTNQDSKLASEANNNLALFIRDLFGVFDRVVITDLLFIYIHDTNSGIQKDEKNATTFLFYKFDFLKIICDYEHYINLNIPVPYSLNNIQHLSIKINDSHPVSGILIREVLEILFNTQYSHEVRNVAFNCINTLLTKHDYDSRYQEPQKKERIATIYFPLILDVIDHYDKFVLWVHSSDIQERRNFMACQLFILKNLSKSFLRQWFAKEVPQRLNTFFDVLGLIASAFEYQQSHIRTQLEALHYSDSTAVSPSTSSVNMMMMMNGANSNGSIGGSGSNIPTNIPTPPPIISSGKLAKELFMKKKDSVLSPLKESGLSRTSSSSSMVYQGNLAELNALNNNNSAVGNNPITASSPNITSPAPLTSASSFTLNSSSPPNLTTGGTSPTLQAVISSVTAAAAANHHHGGRMMAQPLTHRHKVVPANEGNVCSEANLIILDFIEDYIKNQYNQLKDGGTSSLLMEKLFYLFILMLEKRQSHRVITCLYASLRSFVYKFRHHFFQVNNDYCSVLCNQIIRYCNFPSREIRSIATSFFYSMIKHNNQESGNFGRMKIQATIALSKIANSGVFKNDFRNLERAFRTISKYSIEELKNESECSIITPRLMTTLEPNQIIELKSSFSNQILKMSNKLIKIIRDTVRANLLKSSSDPETIHELYSEIAAGYSDTPIIRIDWLNILSSKHVEEENYFEAAICKLRIAQLVYVYLEQHLLLPCKLETSLIQTICPGLSEVVVEEDEGVCTNPVFSIDGLRSTIYLAINQFRMGDYFEYSILLYKLLIPLYEKLRDFENLSECHKQIYELYREIIKANESKSRMLGRYYRVGFYGEAFEDLDGMEFIYKEPKLTHLFALSERLKTFYHKKFGQEVVVFPDSGKIERSNLEPHRLYLQITSLKPYLQGDTENRPGYFERHTLLKHFVFITPFTLTGKTQGSITEQFHRKTILTIENTAPNMLKRFPIVSKKEIEISPIENSIETIEHRNNLLSLEINQDPPNIKTLQGVLQGSVLLQVNAGALEVCRGFLANSNRSNWPSHHIEKLSQACTKFLKLCEVALSINKVRITMNQYSFHQELELGYKRLYATMNRYILGEINSEAEEQGLDTNDQPDMAAEEESSLMTDLSYDDESSIKESSPNLIDNILSSPSSIIPNSFKKKSGFLTVKEDKKSKRGSYEFGSPSNERRSKD